MSVQDKVRDRLRQEAHHTRGNARDRARSDVRGRTACPHCHDDEVERRAECNEDVLLANHPHQASSGPERGDAVQRPRAAHVQPEHHEQRDRKRGTRV